jgi:hypothetical protein
LIRDARMGELVKVVGRLRGNGWEFKAPLSAASCLWYQAVVKTLDVPAVANAAFLFGFPYALVAFVPGFVSFLARFPVGKTITEEESVDLFIDDKSGSAIVDARSARFSLVGMRTGWDGAWVADANIGRAAAALRFLERYAVTAGGPVMYREAFLKEGDTVAVLGRPRMELDPTSHGDFRTPPTRIVFDEPGQVLVSDEPGVF